MPNAPVRLSETVTIAQPTQVVWDVIADHGADVRWRAGPLEMVLRGASRWMKPLVAKIMTASPRKDLQLLKEQLEAGAGS